MFIESNKGFYVEKQYNYKSFMCYYGMTDLGYRCGYVIVDKRLFSKSNINFKEITNKVECDLGLNTEITYSREDGNEPNIHIFGFDYGHFHNGYDIDSFLKYFKGKEYEDMAVKLKEKMELYPGYLQIGTPELCEENIKLICDFLSMYVN